MQEAASMADSPAMCPSARCKPGALLLGVVQAEGRVAFLPEKLRVTGEFVEAANRGRTPEKRFCFGGACVRDACRQWTGSRCNVIDKVIGYVGATHIDSPLPRCSIRKECRWYRQRGGLACAVCPIVVTDLITEGNEKISRDGDWANDRQLGLEQKEPKRW